MRVVAPRWRSILFVPATAERLIAGAQTRGADAVQLDLEDALPPTRGKRRAPPSPASLAILAKGPGDVLVRINRPWRDAVRDLEAVVHPGLSAVTLPKTGGPADLQVVSDILDELEAERGLPAGRIGVIAQVEDALSLRTMGAATSFPNACAGSPSAPRTSRSTSASSPPTRRCWNRCARPS